MGGRLPNEQAVTAVAFLNRARAWFAAHGIIRTERIVTDNGPATPLPRSQQPSKAPGISGSRRTPRNTTAKSSATTGSLPKSSSTPEPGPRKTSDARRSKCGTCTTTITGPTELPMGSRQRRWRQSASTTCWPHTPGHRPDVLDDQLFGPGRPRPAEGFAGSARGPRLCMADVERRGARSSSGPQPGRDPRCPTSPTPSRSCGGRRHPVRRHRGVVHRFSRGGRPMTAGPWSRAVVPDARSPPGTTARWGPEPSRGGAKGRLRSPTPGQEGFTGGSA